MRGAGSSGAGTRSLWGRDRRARMVWRGAGSSDAELGGVELSGAELSGAESSDMVNASCGVLAGCGLLRARSR